MDSHDDSKPSLFSTRPPLKSDTATLSPLKMSQKSQEALQQIFNTALVRTQSALSAEDITRELLKSVGSPAFRAILAAVHHLSADEGIDEKQAAEQIIATFRKLDRLWGEYICREGSEAVLRPRS